MTYCKDFVDSQTMNMMTLLPPYDDPVRRKLCELFHENKNDDSFRIENATCRLTGQQQQQLHVVSVHSAVCHVADADADDALVRFQILFPHDNKTFVAQMILVRTNNKWYLCMFIEHGMFIIDQRSDDIQWIKSPEFVHAIEQRNIQTYATHQDCKNAFKSM